MRSIRPYLSKGMWASRRTWRRIAGIKINRAMERRANERTAIFPRARGCESVTAWARNRRDLHIRLSPHVVGLRRTWARNRRDLHIASVTDGTNHKFAVKK